MKEVRQLLEEAYMSLTEDDFYKAHANMQAASEHWINAWCEKFAIQWQSLSFLQRIDMLAKRTPMKKDKLKVMFEWYFVSIMVTHRHSVHVSSLVRCLDKLEAYIYNDFKELN